MSFQKLVFLPGRLGGGKVLTSTQLKKRGFHLASKCPFCGREEEELEHLLIHCPSIWGQWTDLLSTLVCLGPTPPRQRSSSKLVAFSS